MNLLAYVGTSNPSRLQAFQEHFDASGLHVVPVMCERLKDGAKGAIACHQNVARRALKDFNGIPGVYLDIEDNARMSLRFDLKRIEAAADWLRRNPEHMYVSMVACVLPKGATRVHAGSGVYRKSRSLFEPAQAALCTTDFARLILKGDVFEGHAFDRGLEEAGLLNYITYPTPFRRSYPSECNECISYATTWMNSGLTYLYRETMFRPASYDLMEKTIHHARLSMFVLMLLIILIVARARATVSA
tara:strand:+ start:191 stop:928 length:738 start_codon:yes stop_codon:yes gene_type:complete